MSLFAAAGFSVRDAQAGEKRGGIAAHKYEGLTIFQRTSSRLRRDRGVAAAGPIIQHAAERALVKKASNRVRENAHFATGNEPVKMDGYRNVERRVVWWNQRMQQGDFCVTNTAIG